MPGSARQGLRDDMFSARPLALGSEEVGAATKATGRHLGLRLEPFLIVARESTCMGNRFAARRARSKGLRSYIDIRKLVKGGVAVAVGVEGY